MTKKAEPAVSTPAQPPPSLQPVPGERSRLLTEPQVIEALTAEIAASSLTEVARKYSLQASQVNDIVKGRAGLSRRVVERLRLKLHRLYEKQGRKD